MKEETIMADSIIGTPPYIAPEIQGENYTEKCDIWSCGVMLYILICGYAPFNGENDREIIAKIKKGSFSFPSTEWSTISTDLKRFIQKLLTYEYSKR